MGLSAGMGAGGGGGVVVVEGRSYIFLQRHLLFLQVFVTVVSTTSLVTLSHPRRRVTAERVFFLLEALRFGVSCPVLSAAASVASSHSHAQVSHSSSLLIFFVSLFFLPFTFIRWRHSKRPVNGQPCLTRERPGSRLICR